MRRASEKSEEELSTFITLWKYYLKLNREEDVLNLIATLTEHEKLDEEAVAIVLSTAIKYGKFEEGALFGRSVFK
jgi:Trp operon repressor